jgi:cold shock CspA family protein
MPDPIQSEQTNTNAKTDAELERGTVVSWNGRYAFVRPDRGGSDCYVGTPELVRAGIKRLEVGTRLCFEPRQATHHRQRWCARIRLVEPTT